MVPHSIAAINEDFIYFIWEEILPSLPCLTLKNGKKVKIIHPGFRNTSTGPDFFNAMVDFGDVKMAGNVEIHTRTSHWNKHHHSWNPAYRPVILHVVWEHDLPISNQENLLELKSELEEELFEKAKIFFESPRNILPCEFVHVNLEPWWTENWFATMATERWMERCDILEKKFIYFKYNWHQLFYSVILESFGFHHNALAMFRLSDALPLHILLKERRSLFHLNALLLGTSGIVYEMPASAWRQKVLEEYEYLKNKYSLNPLPDAVFKVHGIRPANHPALRLRQFARLFYQTADMFQTLEFPKHAPELIRLISSSFTKKTKSIVESNLPPEKSPGRQSIQLITLNGWALFLFFYGQNTAQEHLKRFSFEILQQLPAENNFKTRLFRKISHPDNSALYSQAKIHIFNEYCRKKRCLSCMLGRKLLKEKTFKFAMPYDSPNHPLV